MLKKFLILIVVVYSLYSVRHYFEDRHIRNESQSYVTQVVTGIASSWDTTLFDKYADSSLKSSPQIAASFANYRRLGKLQKEPQCDMAGTTSYKYPGTSATYVGVTYQCDAQFEHAPAVIQLALYRFSETPSWKIKSFELISSYLTPVSKR